jgi:hypothetical protein
MKTTPPPKISAHAQEFFSAVVDRYDLEAHHLVVLRGVVQQMDGRRARGGNSV